MVILNKYMPCGDTGTTTDMHPDHKVFVSYRCVYGKYAVLGNNTQITIEGIGTVVHKLNEKMIKKSEMIYISCPFAIH